MELLDPGSVVLLVRYGGTALLLGILLVAPLELLVYGAVRAMGFLRL